MTEQPTPHSINDIKRLYEALQSQGVPLVDNQSGQPLASMLPKKRILALSQHGDMTWKMCQYILAWLIECGDEELQARSIETRAYWSTHQAWVINWCNDHMYFMWCELALKSTKTYKQALAMFPSEAGSIDATVRQLALKFAEDITKPTGLRYKRIPRKGKSRRHT